MNFITRVAAIAASAALVVGIAPHADARVRHRPHAAAAAFDCPTRQSAVAGDPTLVVAPPNTGQAVAASEIPQAQGDVRQSLYQAEKYLLSTGNVGVGAYNAGPSTELAVRVPAMSAFTLAVGLRTNAYAPSVTGVTNAAARNTVNSLVHDLVCQYKEVAATGGWGSGWQTAHWAFLIGTAAWLTWDDYGTTTRQNIVAMVRTEANRLGGISAPYWSKPDGTVNTPGDSKAEENAWNSELLWFAAMMMPGAGNAAAWKNQAVQYAVTAYSTEADNGSGAVVNGVSLANRLNGFNAYDDGTVVNHHIIHPDYANAIQLLWQSADLAALAGKAVPEAYFRNAGLVYSGLSTREFTPGEESPAGGQFLAPGGVVYQPQATPDLYFPQGDDWGVGRRALYVSLDAHATAYAPYVNPTGQGPAEALAQHESDQQDLIASSGATDGRTYSVTRAAEQDTYPGREEYAAESMATGWLALYVAHIGLPALTRATYTVPGTDRTPSTGGNTRSGSLMG